MNSIFTHFVFNGMNFQSEAMANNDTTAAARVTSPAPFVSKEDSSGSPMNIGGGSIEGTTQPGTSTLNLESGTAQNRIISSGTITLDTTYSLSSLSGVTGTPDISVSQLRRSPRQSPKPILYSPEINTAGTRLQRLSSGKQLFVPIASNRRNISLVGKNKEEERLLDEDGYDSDGECGPFIDPNEIPLDNYEEETLQMEQHIEVTINTEPVATNSETAEMSNTVDAVAEVVVEEAPVSLTVEACETLNVKDINAELKKRRIAKKGKSRKNDLLALLKDAVRNGVPIYDENETSGVEGERVQAPSIEDGFSHSARWVELQHLTEPVTDPMEEGFRSPTQPAEQTIKNTRFNFGESFDRPVFKELSPEWRLTRSSKNARVQMDGRGNPRYFSSVREKGRAKVSWLEKHGLNPHSQPWEFVESLLRTDLSGVDKKRTLFDDWASWTNAKAILGNVGNGGAYRSFTDFHVDEIKKFVGLYCINGLNISPRIEYKFGSQEVDWVNGNDVIHNAFGRSAVQRHKQFKYLFAVQDPMVPIPSRKKAPNHKVDHMFAHMLRVFADSYDVGKDIAGDEQDAPFQGRHQDKQRVTYKKAGDGFMIDSICEHGFTISFYPRNAAPPKKWIDKGFSPTHSRILSMFESLDGKYFRCGMDNLFISAKFLYGAFEHCSSKVLVHGVCRKTGRGLPSSVYQEEHKDPTSTKAQEARGATKAAVLVGDETCKNMLAFSVYDSKPVYFLSMAAENIKWIKKKRKFYDATLHKEKIIKFLRTDIQEKYNFNMNSVDIADQLRDSYNFQRFGRNRKWWWSYWMWAMGVNLVNAYRLYVTAHENVWKTNKKELLDHYEFRKNICQHWIDPKMKFVKKHRLKRKTVAYCEEVVEEDDAATVTSGRTRGDSVGLAKKQKTVKAPRVNAKSLNPLTGSLRMRLSNKICHLPRPEDGNGQVKCALHRFVNRSYEHKKNVMKCSTCCVSLCIHCYTIFHEVKNISEITKQVEHVIEENNQCVAARETED